MEWELLKLGVRQVSLNFTVCCVTWADVSSPVCNIMMLVLGGKLFKEPACG